MKLWQIVKGMSEGKYVNGQKFVNNCSNIIVIYNDELVWEYDKLLISMELYDVSEWEEV